MLLRSPQGSGQRQSGVCSTPEYVDEECIYLEVCPHPPTGPAWEDNCQEGPFCLQVADPYFDPQMDGWVLSRYADVTAAFHSPDLVLVGPASKEKYPSVDETARLKMRAETRDALSPVALRSWRRQTLSDARERVAQFDCDQSCRPDKGLRGAAVSRPRRPGHTTRSVSPGSVSPRSRPTSRWRQRSLWTSSSGHSQR